MRWSITIGSFGGTAVKIHITFILFLAWIAFSAWSRGGPAAALDSTVFIVLLFACVVLHEFGHIAAARRYGIGTPEVTLLPIGGVASLQRLPSDPVPGAGGRARRARRQSRHRPPAHRSHRPGSSRRPDADRQSEPVADQPPGGRQHLSRRLQSDPRLPDGRRARFARAGGDAGRRPAGDRDRGEDRPGARLRPRVSRPVRQSAARVHRHLRLHRRGRGSADERRTARRSRG